MICSSGQVVTSRHLAFENGTSDACRYLRVPHKQQMRSRRLLAHVPSEGEKGACLLLQDLECGRICDAPLRVDEVFDGGNG